MPVLNAEVAMALGTSQLQHLLLPASLFGAAVCENLISVPPGVKGAISVHVLADHHIWDVTSPHWDGGITEWTHRHLHILLECKGTLMTRVGKMVFTEILFAGITRDWQKI